MKTIEINGNAIPGATYRYPSVGNYDSFYVDYKGQRVEVLTLQTTPDKEACKKNYLYLFPGAGSNPEWRDCAHIDRLMSYINNDVKQHPPMTIVMPLIFMPGSEYSGPARTRDAQEITGYIADIVDKIEGAGAWASKEAYKHRAVAGLCLGSLCALKLALHWEYIPDASERYSRFFSLGMFSPANGADEAARWIGNKDVFKFLKPDGHYVYISCGEHDERVPHAKRYVDFFVNNGTENVDHVTINHGYHNWDAFNTGFADYMTKEIFAPECYKDILK